VAQRLDQLDALGQVPVGGALAEGVLPEVLERGRVPVGGDDDRGGRLGPLGGVERHQHDLVDVGVGGDEGLHRRTCNDHPVRALDLVGVAVEERGFPGLVADGDVARGVPAVGVARRPHGRPWRCRADPR
jgi:hypothetical protein